MLKHLNEDLRENLLDGHVKGDDFRFIFKFDNGLGASVVRHKDSYDIELAVLEFDAIGNWTLTYDTPITDDVLGYLSFQDVDNHLQDIKSL